GSHGDWSSGVCSSDPPAKCAARHGRGIGWHEARIPTIATPVPRGAFSWVTRKLKGHVSLPLVTTNRINDPQVADDILSRGDADQIGRASGREAARRPT